MVNHGQVYSALRCIKTAKSPSPNDIPNKLLKKFDFELAPVLSDIYNASILQGTFPSKLKHMFVVPIPKVSPPNTIQEDLCPISLTPQVAKIMEGFTLESLLSQIMDKLDSKQFGLPKKSTIQALVYLMHQILSALDKGHCSSRDFFADFKKGFDMIDHNIIITELEKHGVHPAIVRWIKSLLTDREQCFRMGNGKYSWKKINGGLPQGTKLEPLLFATMVNSLLKDWQGRIKYVDDTSALEIIPRCSPSLLPLVVDKIFYFAVSRGMKKCKEIMISFLQYDLQPIHPIHIPGTLVERVSCYKLLGVIVSQDLTWNSHVDYILKKANSRLY